MRLRQNLEMIRESLSRAGERLRCLTKEHQARDSSDGVSEDLPADNTPRSHTARLPKLDLPKFGGNYTE